MFTVAAMTLTGVGGGAVAGIVNMPHAAAASAQIPAYTPVVQIKQPVPTTSTTVAPAPAPTTTIAPAPPTTVAPPAPPTTVAKPAPAPVPEQQAVASAVQTRSQTPAAPAQAATDTCSAALAYLQANSAPGFTFECPGYALGHQAMTCVNVSGVCPGQKLIVISTVCQASYMNEAHNSWVVEGLRSGSIDPYGYCH